MNPFQINNPDKRVEILKQFALDRNEFKQDTPLLDFALEVEKITTAKVCRRCLFFSYALLILEAKFDSQR